MNHRSILITGGSGYIGKQLVQALATQAKRVVSTDIRETPANLKLQGVVYEILDIRKPGLENILHSNNIDTVVHLASIVTPGKKANRDFEYSVDVEGTQNVLRACVKAGVRHIIVSSSGAAYGYHADNPEWLSENDQIRGNYEFAYSWHKRLVEEMLAKYRTEHPELKQTIFRIGTVLGDTVKNQITDLFEKPKIIGIQGSKSPFVFIWDQDLVDIFLMAIENEKAGIFNAAGDGALPLEDIANRLKKPIVKLPPLLVKSALWLLKKIGITQYGPEQLDFLRYRPVLDNKNLKEQFGYKPKKTSAEVFEYWKKARGYTKTLTMLFLLFGIFSTTKAQALEIKVIDPSGKPLETVMVTKKTATPLERDISDNGYPKPETLEKIDFENTAFTNAAGVANFSEDAGSFKIRLRKPGYQDLTADFKNQHSIKLTLQQETDPFKLAAEKPSSAWLGSLDFSNIEKKYPDAKAHFQMQCGFCHQQGSIFTRVERTPEGWKDTIERMIRYGSRLPTDLQKALPAVLNEYYKKLRENPKLVADSFSWSPFLKNVSITEWPVGDQMSQTHDLLLTENEVVYVLDNIQDRVYEVDTKNNTSTVYKIPHKPGEKNGGMLAPRMQSFPKHDSTSNAHSLARSEKDGHIFITPSAQKRLVEFDPKSHKFTLYDLPEGAYPHTIRMDQKDRVWFTLALSNQVACFDRDTKKFTIYDLPPRGFKDRFVSKYIGVLFKLMGWGIPVSNLLKIDWVSSGVPLPYGIDITPDGKVWIARLHSHEIGVIDPDTGKIEMIHTPELGPRRLRTDANGNLWITNFGASSISKYDPATKTFTNYPLPVKPEGSETPYALNVDKKRNVVWVNGNQSDCLYRLDVAKDEWKIYPLPRKISFTRDIEIADDGTIYTSISNFPSWQVEYAQPTLIRVKESSK